MRYKSNLEAPDLSEHFKLLDPPKTILGHDAPSDPDFEPGCTYWTHDEATILFNVARNLSEAMFETDNGRVPWIEIGSRFGWTASHIEAASNFYIQCIDPHFSLRDRRRRFNFNVGRIDGDCNTHFQPIAMTAQEWFEARKTEDPGRTPWWNGACIDGNHDSPEPLHDAMNAAQFLRPEGAVIVMHDFWGKPIRDAANWLLDQGWNCRVYWTPNGVAVLWRGLPDFVPPDHVRDPELETAWDNIRRECAKDFDFRRTK